MTRLRWAPMLWRWKAIPADSCISHDLGPEGRKKGGRCHGKKGPTLHALSPHRSGCGRNLLAVSKAVRPGLTVPLRGAHFVATACAECKRFAVAHGKSR